MNHEETVSDADYELLQKLRSKPDDLQMQSDADELERLLREAADLKGRLKAARSKLAAFRAL